MSILITIRTKIILCRLPSLRSYLKSGKTLKNMKKITLFIMDVGVLDQRFSLSGYWQGKSLVSRVARMPGMLECGARNVPKIWWANNLAKKMNSGGTPYTHISLQAAIYFQYIKFGFIYKYLINIIGIIIIDEYEIIKWINFGNLEILRS